MNWIQLLWIIAALLMLIVLVSVAYGVLHQQANRRPQAIRIAWLIAAISSGTTLFSIGAKVTDAVRKVTVVDVSALAVTGILTGLFLAFAIGAQQSGAKHG